MGRKGEWGRERGFLYLVMGVVDIVWDGQGWVVEEWALCKILFHVGLCWGNGLLEKVEDERALCT